MRLNQEETPTLYTTHYDSPLGRMLLAADGEGLTGLWFDAERSDVNGPTAGCGKGDAPALAQTQRWLDLYFAGREPDFMPPIHMIGSPFRQCVWSILRQIPYGRTTTYGAIAQEIAARQGISRMSAQAVGGAVGHNEIPILIPCHRVVGKNGSLTGYAGGLNQKIWLLANEGVDMTQFFEPKQTRANKTARTRNADPARPQIR